MARPRSSLVSVADTRYYHCTNRCVRRAFLCGDDPLSGQSFEHRRGWILERLALLLDAFAIELCGYALMSNHYHLVLRLAPEHAEHWSEEEVIDRWTRIFKGVPLVRRYREGDTLGAEEVSAARQIVALWRARLANISWFERCLNEYIARRANVEDGCTGRFWEGRFGSQALLDEPALLTAMTYVDLNPVRAYVADTLEASDYTSIQARLASAGAIAPPTPTQVLPPLVPFAAPQRVPSTEPLPFSWPAYVALVDATGRVVRDDKRGTLHGDASRLLVSLGLDPDHWLLAVRELRRRFHRALGAPRRLAALAADAGQRWLHGQRAARRLYSTLAA